MYSPCFRDRNSSNISQTRVVLLSSSKTKPLNVILDTAFTANMNAITAHAVVSFYPRLSMINESLLVDNRDADDAMLHSFDVTSTNSHWTKPCGLYCPAVWRKSYGDPGVAMYPWNPASKPAKPDSSLPFGNPRPLEIGHWGPPSMWPPLSVPSIQPTASPTDIRFQEAVRWRIKARCDNPHCPNSVLRSRREAVLGLHL